MILANPDVVKVVSSSAEELLIPTKNPPVWNSCYHDSLRPPVTVLMRAGEFDFRLVGVHLKSNLRVRNVSDDEEKEIKDVCDNDIRQWQAEEIVKHLKTLQAEDGEDDAIIVGDFNAPFSAEEFYPLRHAEFVSLIPEDCFPDDKDQIGCTHLVAPDASHPPSVLDLIVVPRGIEEAVGDGEIGSAEAPIGDYLTTQSDHLPVWAEFYTDRDVD
jgi:hypothetical protein